MALLGKISLHCYLFRLTQGNHRTGQSLYAYVFFFPFFASSQDSKLDHFMLITAKLHPAFPSPPSSIWCASISHWVQQSNSLLISAVYCAKMLTSMNFRNFLPYLCHAVLFFQQIWDQSLLAQSFFQLLKKGSPSFLLLTDESVANTQHHVAHAVLPIYPDQQALSLLITHPKAELHTFSLFSHKKGKKPCLTS